MISQDLAKLKQWAYDNLCKGKAMKAQGGNATEVKQVEPRCFLMRLPSIQQGGFLLPDEVDAQMSAALKNAAPCIIVVMRKAGVKNSNSRMNDEKPDGKRGYLEVQFLFATYDPGHRTREGQEAADEQTAIKNIKPNDEEAIGVALDWAQEAMSKLLMAGGIPGTGWTIENNDWEFGPLADDNGFLADRWPFIYSILMGTFTTPSAGITACAASAEEAAVNAMGTSNNGTKPVYLD